MHSSFSGWAPWWTLSYVLDAGKFRLFRRLPGMRRNSIALQENEILVGLW